MSFLSKSYVLLVALSLFFANTSQAVSSEINLIANNLYPTAYVENGKVKGLAIEISRAVLKRAGLAHTSPTIFPYKRALFIAENSSNTVLASLARTPSRANNFSWIGRLVVAARFFVSPKEAAEYSVEDARHLKSIGVLKGSSLESQLRVMGFNNLVPLENEQTAFRMLTKQRIEAWFTSNVLLSGVLLSQGLENRSTLTIGPPLPETADVYMAASKDLPSSHLSKLQSAFDKLESEGVLTTIREKYGLEDY